MKMTTYPLYNTGLMATRKLFSIHLSSDLLFALAEIRKVVERVLRLFTDDEEVVSDMVSIFDEAVSNAMRHAYPKGETGPVKVELLIRERGEDRRFILRVYDEGDMPEGMEGDLSGYKVDVIKRIEQGKVGGLGLHFISNLSDGVFWRKLKKGKYLQVEKRF